MRIRGFWQGKLAEKQSAATQESEGLGESAFAVYPGKLHLVRIVQRFAKALSGPETGSDQVLTRDTRLRHERLIRGKTLPQKRFGLAISLFAAGAAEGIGLAEKQQVGRGN